MGEGFNHTVEESRQFTDLVFGIDLDPNRIVPLSDSLGPVPENLDRPNKVLPPDDADKEDGQENKKRGKDNVLDAYPLGDESLLEVYRHGDGTDDSVGRVSNGKGTNDEVLPLQFKLFGTEQGSQPTPVRPHTPSVSRFHSGGYRCPRRVEDEEFALGLLLQRVDEEIVHNPLEDDVPP